MAKGDGSAMDVSGLAGDWEANASVRQSARDTGLLMRVPNGAALCEPSRPNAVANADVLIPCLERMASTGLKLPYMTPLQDEVEIFFRQVHVKVSEKIAYRTAGELKRMLSFIKRKANKKEEHIDLYMAGSLRPSNLATAAREAGLRSRSSGSLEGSTGDENDGEDDEPVDRETDLEEFRRWLDGQPRGAAEPAPCAAVPSPCEAVATAPSHLETVAAVPSRPEAVAVAPSQPEAIAALPSQPEALVSAPSQPEAIAAVPSPPDEALVAAPSQPEAAREPSPEVSTGSKAPSNTKQTAEAELPSSSAKATQPMLNRSRLMATAGSDTGAASATRVHESTWHTPGNCDKCLKEPGQCNSMACIYIYICI
ncbi:unnamed protein product [Symbiodinium sp. CCMP2456]|nr:unnamed protein product [Symbiodinium sp. CCMP2456]